MAKRTTRAPEKISFTQLEVKPKSIVLIHRPPGETDEEKWNETIMSFADMLSGMGFDCVLMAVDRDDDIKLMGQDDMNRLGWYHERQIAMLNEEFPEFDSEEE